MVAQTEIKPAEVRAEARSDLPPKAVARGTAGFLHDVTTLAELQGKLVIADAREGVSKLVTPAILVVFGVAVALGSVPILLAAIALTIKATTTLNYASCFWISVAIGLVLAAALAIPAYYRLRTGVSMFDRSYEEWRRNLQWAKDTLKRLGSNAPSPQNRAPSSRW